MMKPTLPLLLSALCLSACVSLGGGKPPKMLLTLSASTGPVVGSTPDPAAPTLSVITPTAPKTLATNRLAVMTGSTTIAYLKDAQWVDEPARLFSDVLAETIAARTGQVIVDRRQYALAPGMRLTGRLHQFGLDAEKDEVVIVYDATLFPGGGKPMAARRFEARLPVSSEKVPVVAHALNQASNRIANEVADWISR